MLHFLYCFLSTSNLTNETKISKYIQEMCSETKRKNNNSVMENVLNFISLNNILSEILNSLTMEGSRLMNSEIETRHAKLHYLYSVNESPHYILKSSFISYSALKYNIKCFRSKCKPFIYHFRLCF